LAARYKFSDYFLVRGSVNNGFRAPSLQQRYYSGSNQSAITIGGVRRLGITGTFREHSDVAAALGIPSLKAERSVNGSGGFTATLLNRIRLTVDAYWIQIRNRIVLSGQFERSSNPEIDNLLRGYSLDIDLVRFFANAINTRTRGVDAMLNGTWKIKNASLVATLAAHFTRTRLLGEIKTVGKLEADSLNTTTLFDRYERGRLEWGQPDNKIIFSLNFKRDKFGFLLRNTRFGKTAIVFDARDESRDQFFSPKVITDLSINYTLKSWLTFTVGVNNAFNVYPDRIKDYRNTDEGRFIYGQEATPFGINGAYYFVSTSVNF
jgi:iron complex outermembrane receptor protein